MRFNGMMLVAAAVVLGACGGGDNKAADTGTAAVPAAGATTAATPSTPAAGAPAPATGATHEVKMIGDDKGYRYEPADLTIKAGDAVKFIMVSGGPHNVTFQNVPADVRAQLSANMPNQMSDLSSPMLLNANEAYTVSFAGVKPGKYDYICTPHMATGMKGSITVQ
jgi:plastocyanin